VFDERCLLLNRNYLYILSVFHCCSVCSYWTLQSAVRLSARCFTRFGIESMLVSYGVRVSVRSGADCRLVVPEALHWIMQGVKYRSS